MDAHPQRRWHAAARLGITRELLAHIDALEAALKATYDAERGTWVVFNHGLERCPFCDAKLFSLRNGYHKPDCQGEALKAALGLNTKTQED